MKLAPVDEGIFREVLASFDEFGLPFERQAGGSVTVDACTECYKLYLALDEEWQAGKPANLRPLQGSVFQLRRYVQKENLDQCCGCRAAFPEKYDGCVTTAGPELWICQDCFGEFREAFGFSLQN
jgi:hypothetical protein